MDCLGIPLKRVEPKVNTLGIDKQISGLIESKILSTNKACEKLLVVWHAEANSAEVSNSAPVESNSAPVDSTLCTIDFETYDHCIHVYASVDEIPDDLSICKQLNIVYAISSEDLKAELKYLCIKTVVFACETNGFQLESVATQPFFLHKTVVLCTRDFEHKYFVDHTQGTDFTLAFKNKTVLKTVTIQQLQSSNVKELIVMRHPLDLRPFLSLDITLSVFQTEQLSVPSIRDKFLSDCRALGKPIKVYDYSAYNCAILETFDFFTSVHHLPVQTTQQEIFHLKKLFRSTLKVYDFAHIGLLNKRRLDKIKKIENMGFTVLKIEDFGQTRDFKLAKCKALLNIHQSDDHIVFESCRCQRLVDAEFQIFSEDSTYNNTEFIKSIDDLTLKKHEITTIKQKKIIIYVLCYNDEKFEQAKSDFKNYFWAKPIKIKNGDILLQENDFWEQLLSIEDEWSYCKYVGTISCNAKKKIDINELDKKINKVCDNDNNVRYIPFAEIKSWLFENSYHDSVGLIVEKTIKDLKLKKTKYFVGFNYFMCNPFVMKKFIYYFRDVLLPHVLKDERIYKTLKYDNPSKHNISNYNHIPFVLERLNPCFFETYII